MDLISAKVEAAKKSRTTGKKQYIIVDNDAECHIKEKCPSDLETLMAVFMNGSEMNMNETLEELRPDVVIGKAPLEIMMHTKSSNDKRTKGKRIVVKAKPK